MGLPHASVWLSGILQSPLPPRIHLCLLLLFTSVSCSKPQLSLLDINAVRPCDPRTHSGGPLLSLPPRNTSPHRVFLCHCRSVLPGEGRIPDSGTSHYTQGLAIPISLPSGVVGAGWGRRPQKGEGKEEGGRTSSPSLFFLPGYSGAVSFQSVHLRNSWEF